MAGNTRRDATYLLDLQRFILAEYQLEPTEITPAKRGFFGETWKLDTHDRAYFVKLDYTKKHRLIYERSFPVLKHLMDHGIDFISQVVKTADGRLSTRYNGAVLGVFNWIDGENIETDETKQAEYHMLARVYATPTEGLAIPREDFSDKSAKLFFSQWESLQDARTLELFAKNREKLLQRAERLSHFASLCQKDVDGFFITHGDAGGNLIIAGHRTYLVDWDDPLLAPPERDAWNMVCTGKEWAGRMFQEALFQNGIRYELRPERLAYYCYYYCFYYLTEYLDQFTPGGTPQDIERYLAGWVESRAAYADTHFTE